MTLTAKHGSAFNFAVCVLCIIGAVRVTSSPIGSLLLAVLAVANAFFFVVSLCNFIEVQCAAKPDNGNLKPKAPDRG